MKRIKLKPFVLPTLYFSLVVALLFSVLITRKEYNDKTEKEIIYVTSSILDSYVPVVNVNQSVDIIRPYLSDKVTIGINFYNETDDDEAKKKSIIYYENTYMPNSGIDYISDEIFDVVSILDGEVIDVEEEELLGKVITIKHSNNVISVYQSLSETNVSKGDTVQVGQVIGKSGNSVINKELNNHLHFELIVNGTLKDPEDYYGKKQNELN